MTSSPAHAAPTPDPVSQPSAYRDVLLSLVGTDDPASVQRRTPFELRDLAWRAGEAHALRTPPAPGEWSIIELLGHFADAELVSSARYRWIVAHDTPEIAAYDQDLWATRLLHREAGAEELLDLFGALRRANLSLWDRIPEDQRDRYGVHAERGPESYEVTFRMIAGHDRFHLRQARETLAAVTA